MYDAIELNRLEYMILETLHEIGSQDPFHGMTIKEILDANEGALGARMTVYKKLRKLVKLGYIAKGCVDNHADTFYLLDKGIQLFTEGE